MVDVDFRSVAAEIRPHPVVADGDVGGLAVANSSILSMGISLSGIVDVAL